MTYEKSVDVQNTFLDYLGKNKVAVTIFLLNGVKLNGTISGFDQDVVILKKDGYAQLIYKHAISTFCPHGLVNLLGWSTQLDNEADQGKVGDSHDDLEEAEYDRRGLEDEEYL
jgi:host factor-I protein